jgi:hypothetical protein
MARKRVEQEMDEATLPIVSGRKTKATGGKLIDPQAPLPGAMKRVGPKPAQTAASIKKADPKHLREKFNEYCKHLATHYGDPVPALALTFNISEVEAEERQTELHNEIMRAMQGMTTRDLLAQNGMSKEHRLMRMKQFMYSENPVAAIKAMDMIGELDGATKSSGDTWEDWIAMSVKQK